MAKIYSLRLIALACFFSLIIFITLSQWGNYTPYVDRLKESVSSLGPGSQTATSKYPTAPFPDDVYNKPRVAIVTFTTSEKSYTHTVLKNKAAYAQRHGYDLFTDFDQKEPRGVMWYKFTMMERLIMRNGRQGTGIGGFQTATQPEYDWIWWIDFDTLFTNMSRPVGDVIKEALASLPHRDEVDVLLTPDCWPLNAGSMIYRAHPRTIPFFNLARAYSDIYPRLVEQDVVRDLVFGGNPGWDYHGLSLPKLAKYSPWHPESVDMFNKNRSESPAFIHLGFTGDDFPQHVRENAGKFPKTGMASVLYNDTGIDLSTLKPDEGLDANLPSEKEFRYPSGKRTFMLNQSSINAFPPEIKCYDRRENRSWKKGDLVIHFAGAWAHLKDEPDATGFLMRKYEPEIIN